MKLKNVLITALILGAASLYLKHANESSVPKPIEPVVLGLKKEVKKQIRKGSENLTEDNLLALETEAMDSPHLPSRVPVSGVLYGFEQTKDITLIKEFNDLVNAESNHERDSWLKNMPVPRNEVQELLLYTLSTVKFDSPNLGSFKEAYLAVGTSLDQIEGHAINDYLHEVIVRSQDLNESEMLSAAYHYNSTHAVDYQIGKMFKKDIQLVIEGKQNLKPNAMKLLFQTVLLDQQIPIKKRKLYATELLDRFDNPQTEQEMLKLVQTNIDPLIKN